MKQNHKEKTVLVFGTFDVLHPGHRFFLEEAAANGDRLIAVVSRDLFVETYKGRPPLHTEEQRMQAVLDSGLAAEAVLADPEIRTYETVRQLNPDIICLGHDQTELLKDLERWMDETGINIPLVMISSWKRDKYSSTLLTERSRKIRKGLFYGLMVLAMGLWGFSWISGKYISGMTTANNLVFWRFLLSFLSFIPIVLIRKENLRIRGRTWVWVLLAPVVLVVYNQLFFNGLRLGLAGKGGVIVTTLNPLFAFILFAMVSRKMPRFVQIIGLVTGLLGGLLLIKPWAYSMEELLQSGNLYFLFAALLWSLLTVISQQAQKNLSLMAFNFYIYLFATILNLFFALPDKPLSCFQLPLFFWLHLIYIAVGAGSVAAALYFNAAKKLGAGQAGTFTFIVPVVALFFSWLLLNENPGELTIIGGLICLCAVYLVNSRKQAPSAGEEK